MNRILRFVSEFKVLLLMAVVKHLPRFKQLDYYKYKVYRIAGINIERGCEICGVFEIKGNLKNITIGKNNFFNKNIFFESLGRITIGNYCQIGPNVSFETVSHNLELTGNFRKTIVKNVIIDDHVWIGINSTILQGVTIGKGSVIAAGSVVVKDVPMHTVYGGVPAKFIKSIPH